MKIKSIIYDKWFILVITVCGIGLYCLGEAWSHVAFSYLSILFFLPSIIFLISEFKTTFKEVNIIWKLLFFLGELVILYSLGSSKYYESNILIEFLTDYLLFLFIAEILAIFFCILKNFLGLLRRICQNKVKNFFNKFIFKKYWLFVLLFTAIGFLVWQNQQLINRVDRLETVIGESRLFCNEQEAIEKAKESTVRIIGPTAQGSGFFIKDFGYLLTNYHVVADSLTPKVVLPDYTVLQGKVLSADQQSDLAIVKVDLENEKISELEFGDIDSLKPLDDLISVGYPLGTAVRGEASASKGHFVDVRTNDDAGINHIQTDFSIAHGTSGGPMIDICGKVMGINTFTYGGLSMAISAKDFVDYKWEEMLNADDPVKDVKKIEFYPNQSAKHCVEAFYNYQTTGELKKAFDLLSKEYTSWTFDRWERGYENTLYIVFVNAQEDEEDENTVFVKFYSADLIDEKLVIKYFEGTQEVKEVNSELKLKQSDISEVIDPNWEWFWTDKDENWLEY